MLAFAAGELKDGQLARVHTHLDDCEVCQSVLIEAAHSLATDPTTLSEDANELFWRTTLQRGTLVGNRYLIRRFIDRGGMGEVYEAFDQELQERVALKTVTSTAGDNPQAVRRLKGEVQLARRVSHPNVCRIYDFGTHGIGEAGPPVPFLTMEFVEGQTLGARIRAHGPVPEAEALPLVRHLLLGLSAAHEAGVMHRDFKSDNVMLRANGDRSPLILDFGLARALDNESSAVSSVLVGTPGYIAPEQVEGKPHTQASDVYAFGVVWYHLLTGELPSAERHSAPPSSRRSRRNFSPPSTGNGALPRQLEPIVLKCLQPSPSDRFASASAVLRALDALEPRPVRGRQRRLQVAGLCALCALIGTGVLAARGPQQRSLVPVHSSVSPRPPSTARVTRSPEPAAPVSQAHAEAAASGASPSAPPVASAAPVAFAHRLPRATTSALVREPPKQSEPLPSPSAPLAIGLGSSPTAGSTEVPKPPPDWEDPFHRAAADPASAGLRR